MFVCENEHERELVLVCVHVQRIPRACKKGLMLSKVPQHIMPRFAVVVAVLDRRLYTLVNGE